MLGLQRGYLNHWSVNMSVTLLLMLLLDQWGSEGTATGALPPCSGYLYLSCHSAHFHHLHLKEAALSKSKGNFSMNNRYVIKNDNSNQRKICFKKAVLLNCCVSQKMLYQSFRVKTWREIWMLLSALSGGACQRTTTPRLVSSDLRGWQTHLSALCQYSLGPLVMGHIPNDRNG